MVYSSSDQRLASQTLPETGTTSFAYNTLGLLKSKTDAKGIRKELTYDTKQRVTAVRYYAGSTEKTGTAWTPITTPTRSTRGSPSTEPDG